MELSRFLKMNIMGENDDADILKVAENFEKLDRAAKDWSNFGNTGTVLETGGDFQVATVFPVPDEEGAIFAITLKMPRAYAEGDTVTVDGIAYNLYQGTDPALSDAWKSGEVVTVNFDKTSRRCWASAGGGAPRPLPAQVSNMQASTPEGETPSIVFSWTNPQDENFAGMVLIVKEGSAPNSVTDGTQVYKGSGTAFTYTEGVQWEHTYFARGFAYNSQGKYQLDATGAIASATPSNIPSPVTQFQVQTEYDTATLVWTNPTEQSYAKTVVVQKIGAIPQNLSDGTEVYSGTETTVTVGKLQDKIVYYWRAFAVSKTDKYNAKDAPHTTYTPRLVPDSYQFLKCITANEEWTPPENGTYRITCIGASSAGDSGGWGGYYSSSNSSNYYSGDGGKGGNAGGIARSILGLRATEKIHCTVNSTVCSFGSYLSATGATVSNPGTGTGGTDFNTTGNSGGSGGRGYAAHSGGNGTPIVTEHQASNGSRGGGNGALGGSKGPDGSINNAGGGGGGGGGTYKLPDDIKYDDVLYTTYTKRDLSAYRGGNGGGGDNGWNGTVGQSYPSFSSLNPIWYGGGNGGGGGRAITSSSGNNGSAGSQGSPGGILIEKGVFD